MDFHIIFAQLLSCSELLACLFVSFRFSTFERSSSEFISSTMARVISCTCCGLHHVTVDTTRCTCLVPCVAAEVAWYVNGFTTSGPRVACPSCIESQFANGRERAKNRERAFCKWSHQLCEGMWNGTVVSTGQRVGQQMQVQNGEAQAASSSQAATLAALPAPPPPPTLEVRVNLLATRVGNLEHSSEMKLQELTNRIAALEQHQVAPLTLEHIKPFLRPLEIQIEELQHEMNKMYKVQYYSLLNDPEGTDAAKNEDQGWALPESALMQ